MALQPCSPARYRELPLLIRQPPWLSWRGPPDIFCAGSRRNLASRVDPPTTLPIGMSKGVLSNQSPHLHLGPSNTRPASAGVVQSIPLCQQPSTRPLLIASGRPVVIAVNVDVESVPVVYRKSVSVDADVSRPSPESGVSHFFRALPGSGVKDVVGVHARYPFR